MSFDQFVSMIELDRLYLTQISQWDDVYEGYAARQFVNIGIHKFWAEILGNDFKEAVSKLCIGSLYAQSWTFDEQESDAMWRIYSKDKTGVRIKFDEQVILSSISNSMSHELMENKKMSNKVNNFKVEYENEVKDNDIEHLGETWKALQHKRSAFKHEKEYRFVVNLEAYFMALNGVKVSMSDNQQVIKVLNDIIEKTEAVVYYNLPIDKMDEVLLDPRAPKHHEETFMKYCSNRNFNEKSINFNKSKLYTL